MDPREQNVKMNQFGREARQLGIGSPYRMDEYCRYRLKGFSKERALEKTKNHRRD